MYNYYNKRKYIFSIFLILILVIGIGYAYLTSNLSISGNTSVSTNSWNIHFENIQVKDGSVTATTSPTLSNNNTSITYTIDLNRPKEYYEFTVDVKNDGTLPGKVSISELSGITSDAEPIIDYSIKYTNGNPVNIGDILNAGAKKTIKVRVFYKDEIDPSDFPSNDLTLNLTYTLQYIQSEEDGPPSAFDTIVDLAINNACITKYEGQVTDQVGQTVTASNVYYNSCYEKRNVIFGGFCWQIVRTTETGGIKMIYNGEAVNNQCSYARGNHKGIIQREISVPSSTAMSSFDGEYLYGSSFNYDIINNTFTLTDTFTSSWSDSTYENLIGTYTCKTSSDTCSTIYSVGGYYSNTKAYNVYYTIGDTIFPQIGRSSFNIRYDVPAMVGYMFNKVYNLPTYPTLTSTSLFGNDVSYSNGTYTLLPASGESTLGTTRDATHHYTCDNTTGVCSVVRFYFGNQFDYYIELEGGEKVEDALYNMLYNDNVNSYDSTIKGIIDAWYRQNLSDKTNMLEDAVYCNDRSMINQGSNLWSKNGNYNTDLLFRNYNETNSLACSNITDQFSTSNNKAKLTYPVALLEHEEILSVLYQNFIQTDDYYWVLSPYDNSYSTSRIYYEDKKSVISGVESSFTSSDMGIRPVVSLSPGISFSSGTGSENNPWVVE